MTMMMMKMMWFFCFGIVRNGIMLGVKGDSFSVLRGHAWQYRMGKQREHTHHSSIPMKNQKLEFCGEKYLSPILDLFLNHAKFLFLYFRFHAPFHMLSHSWKKNKQTNKQTQLFFINKRKIGWETQDGIKFIVNDGGFSQCLHHVYNNSGQNIYVLPPTR